MSSTRMQTSLIAWRCANSKFWSPSVVAKLAETGRRLGSTAKLAADPHADHCGDIGERQKQIVRNAVAEEKLGADAERADDGEKESGAGCADRMRRAENHRGESHEAAPRSHAVREDLQRAQCQLRAAEGA